MNKSPKITVLTIILLFILVIGAGTSVAGESLVNLQAKMERVTTEQEFRAVVDDLNSLPGPDAGAAKILLDSLKEKNRNDAWYVVDALVKLMTDGQVSQLAKDINTYDQDNTRRYLVAVLLARINDPDDLTSVLVSLQEGYFSGEYLQFMEQVWPKIINNPNDAVQWLDETYVRLNNLSARESFVNAIGIVVQKQNSEVNRSAIVDWLWRVQEKEPDYVYRCNQLITLYRLGETGALDVIDGLYSGIASDQDRADLIRRMADIIRWRQEELDENKLIDWLWKIAGTDVSPYCRQAALAALYLDLGQEKALQQFVHDTDQNGLAALKQAGQISQISLGWQLLRDIYQKYPQSFLARGIRVYEEVRGKPYFEIDRPEEQFTAIWVPPYGDEEYDQDREIPGWEKFLAEFSSHPAADDAAYRLARCYEIRGRFADAVNTMQKARFLPDGDMRYAADGRLVYILDVRMTYDQLKALSSEKLEPPLNAFVEYSLAVKEIRRDNYGQAAFMLEEFLKQKKALTDGRYILTFNRLNDNDPYDLFGSVEKQLFEVGELAVLQSQWEKSQEPADLYNLAAAIFHNEMLYYNHLWAGQRQYYNWLGYINATGQGHAPAEMSAYARDLINYNHSLPYFQQVYEALSAEPELKARALYSTGLCYIGLDEWGEDAAFAFNPMDIMERVISAYQQFVKEYPDSSMADDALLALGSYTGEAAYLQQIFEDFPDSDVMEKAKSLLKDMESPYYRPANRYGWSVPFKITLLNDDSVPQEIKEWATANILQPFTGSKTMGEWSYLLIAAGEKPTAGYNVGVMWIYGSSDKLKVNYRVDGPAPGQAEAQMSDCPYTLIRIPACKAQVEFIEGNPR